jgi:hypothetical protein
MVASMLAPEMPNTIRIGGSQQQLDAMMAETTVPMLAMRAPLFDSPESCAATGNAAFVVPQQSWAAATLSSVSRSMVFSCPRGSAKFRFKSFVLNRLQDLLTRGFLRIERHKQQIFQVDRVGIAVPFVIDLLNTVKLYQSLFDPIGSFISVQTQFVAHLGNVNRHGLSQIRIGQLAGGRGRFLAADKQQGG